MSNYCCTCDKVKGKKCGETGNNIEMFIILDIEPDFCPYLSNKLKKAAALYPHDEKSFKDFSDREMLSEKEVSYCRKVSALKKINNWFICILTGLGILLSQMICGAGNTNMRIEGKTSASAKSFDMVRNLRRLRRRAET